MVRRNDSQSKKDEEVKTMDKMFELINSLNALTKAVEGLTAKITSEYLDTFEEIYSPEMDEPKEESKEQPTPEHCYFCRTPQPSVGDFPQWSYC